jgi:hypothetical protein
MTVTAPQGLVTAAIQESATATNLEVAVRQLISEEVLTADGTTQGIYGWANSSVTSQTLFSSWGKTNLMLADSAATAVANLGLTLTGVVLPFAWTTSRSGWLLCDGSAVSRTTYLDLFTAIGEHYGTGNGSTTFNVPDLRGYFIRGSGTNSDGSASGSMGVKQADEFKAHTHTYNTKTADAVQSGSATACWIGNATGTSGSTGGTETRPKNIAMPYYIKT